MADALRVTEKFETPEPVTAGDEPTMIAESSPVAGLSDGAEVAAETPAVVPPDEDVALADIEAFTLNAGEDLANISGSHGLTATAARRPRRAGPAGSS